jgi:hypothetical protein
MSAETDFYTLSQIESFRNPGPATFVSSCAVLSLSMVHLMQHTRHHRYQLHFIATGAFCGLMIGISLGSKETILVDALTNYLPVLAVVAQFFSLILHTSFSSWQDTVKDQQAGPAPSQTARLRMEKSSNVA